MDGTAEPWRQEIRLALTMVGGASLAIWMGGVATETSQLLRESRSADGGGLYRKLLDLLRASVSIDVLTGTSAGGINAACLGLAEAFGSTPQVLRDTWITTGSLENLIRDAKEAQPRSVLDGDRVLLGDVERALRQITSEGAPPVDEPDITVLLTGTMIDGETTRFDDALGNLVRDTEHRMLFRFCGPLWTIGVEGPLALAARSTASFPGAFELSRMPIGTGGTDRLHPDMTPYTELTRSHWLTDGGVLLNKPLRPALREIFERPSHADVRRLLLYVVPTGEGVTDAVECDPAHPPLLSNAMAKVVNTVMSQSISAELDDLTRHNDAVLRARDTRVSLAALGLRGGPECLVDARIAAAYLERRTAEDAAELVRVAARRYALSEAGTSDRDWASGMSRQLRAIAVTGLSSGVPTGPPAAGLQVPELVGYRTTALDDAVATGLQLVNAGFRLRPDAARAATLNDARAQLHAARRTAGRGVRLAQWVAAHAAPGASSTLEVWIRELAEEWAGLGRSAAVAEAWPKVVAGLRAAAPTLRALADADPEKSGTVTTLLNWLALGPDAAGTDEVVQARLLTLHVATRGLLAQAPSVDQRVDLVQVSADSRTLLDMTRRRSWDKLTGMQASYFGAFYKASWRANDWMWGRIDGAGWLVQCLLDPVRLETLRDIVGPERFREEFVAALKPLWRKPDELDRCTPAETGQLRDQLAAELAFLGLDADLEPVAAPDADRPISMPVTAMVLARTRQAEVAAEELPVVTLASRYDADDRRGIEKALAGDLPRIDVGAAQAQFQACRVSAEKLAGEQGTARLTRTLVALGAATVNAGTVAFRLPGGWPQTVAGMLRTVARSTARVSQGASRLGTAGSLVAGVLALLAGLVIGNNGGAVLQWVGLPVLAGAAVYLATALLTTGHKVRWLFTALGALVVAALLLAAFLPPLARPFFGWLGDVVAGWRRGEGAVWWLLVSGLLILPAVVTPVSALLRRLGHRRARNREAKAVVLEVARRPSPKTVERAPEPSSR
ncbi:MULTISPECIES: patatin-like protein [unclassified Amycolatopsis]|uniref:patatin-like protein n=1 Tax=unclassified Amycolatopsis TaxID=2618356 RepID=UPI0028759BB9|nr:MULTISPECIES: patatin-like protein [unclassified Amycolatopsis]MDS0133501.1 patatin-like protein [Amycolatopsis sp. 505]MDS0146731.1 patatin-like protein [Amycolatopsis sp. CM201R]